jgi:hypothetical protein
MIRATLLWLDDYRDPMQGQWLVFSPITDQDFDVHWVKSYYEFVDWIKTNGLPTGICFDHDLSDVQSACVATNTELPSTEKTGMDCAKWLVDYCIDSNKQLPLYNMQSANSVGKENIRSLLENFKAFISS